MSVYFWVKDFLSGPPGGIASRTLLLPLTILAWLFGQAQALRRWVYRRGVLRSYDPGVPVISVGNITAGGTGKTPCVEAVCRLLLAEGKKPAVLARGYRGNYTDSWAVVSDGKEILLDADQAGDEPVLLGHRLHGVPVLVGRDRRVIARIAMERYGAEAIVLDDGFQHLRLARDLDIVTLDARRPYGNGYCFPRGLLRETPRALGGAHLVLVTRTRRADSRRLDSLREEVHRHNPGVPVLRTAHAPMAVVDLHTGSVDSLDALKGLKVLAFSGIGTPDAFFQELKDLGARVLESVPFPDHHWFRRDDLAQLERWARLMNALAIVTTEKDGVRLIHELPLKIPVLALRIEMKVLDDEETFHRLVRRVACKAPSGSRRSESLPEP